MSLKKFTESELNKQKKSISAGYPLNTLNTKSVITSSEESYMINSTRFLNIYSNISDLTWIKESKGCLPLWTSTQKIIQYQEKDIKIQQVNCDIWGPGSHWFRVPCVAITCPQQRNKKHASYGILMLMSLFLHTNKRWAKTYRCALRGSSCSTLHFTS